MKIMRTLLLVSPFLLGACGDGYELVKTDMMFPYGNQRTAGSGYAYVLAKMLPARQEPILQAVSPRSEPRPVEQIETSAHPEEASEVQPQKAEQIFHEKQQK